MYKVIIVDDESWAIDYLIKKLNWSEYGFTVKDVFTDPLEALESVKREPVDVLLLDICMPNISGFELLSEIECKYADIEVVITSAYDEFDFAKKAIQYGVFDYLLKPISEREGDELLGRLSRHLAEKKRYSSKLNDVDILEDLFSGKLDIKTLFKKYEYEFYRMIVVREANLDIINALIPQNINRRILKIGTKKHLIIINCEYNDEIPFDNMVSMMQTIIGVSNLSDDRKEAASIFKQADMAALNDFISENSKIIFYSDPDTRLLKRHLKQILDLIRMKDTEKLKEKFYEVKDVFVEKKIGMAGVEMFYNYIMLYLVNNFENANKKDLSVMEYDQIYYRYSSFKEMCDFMLESISSIFPEKHSITAKKGKHFDKILEYVNSNYMKHISLDEISNRFFLNPSYVSVLFKRNMDKTLFEYINSLRMERAVYLLKNTDKMVLEISDEVGYTDSFHFSKMFKKYYGMSPSEYREKYDKEIKSEAASKP